MALASVEETPVNETAQHGFKAHSDGGWDAEGAAKHVPVQTRSAHWLTGQLYQIEPIDLPS